jgi:quercetin dioxygenase-like cupin family protein
MPSQTSPLDIQLLVAAETTGGACSAFALSGPPGTLIPPHRRGGHDLALIVATGAACVRVDAEERHLGPGELAWLPRGAACRVELLAASRLLCLVLPAGFESLLPGPDSAVPDADDAAVLLGLAGVTLLPAAWGAGAPAPQ